MNAVERCDMSDLPADSCGCWKCRPDAVVIEVDAVPVVIGTGAALDGLAEGVARRFTARWPFVCDRCATKVPADGAAAYTHDGERVCDTCAPGRAA